MYVVSAEQMREMDRHAIEEGGIPGILLMENAGRAVFDVLCEKLGSVEGKRIAVFCGTGNNGGDGFVIARHLNVAGAYADVVFVGDKEKLPPDARLNYELLVTHEANFFTLEQWKEYCATETDAVVDALLGTGFKGEPREEFKQAIASARFNFVIAVDIPSGVNADTGMVPAQAVRADVTVTFEFPKLGHFLFPGANCVGELVVRSIGWEFETDNMKPFVKWFCPAYVLSDMTLHRTISGYEFVQTPACFREPRAQESNKGDYGHVGVVAGSRGMAGAPALAACAAQRSGTGLVTVLAPQCVQPTIAIKLDEQMTVPLSDAEGSLTEEAFEAIQTFAQKATVLCIGPGLTTAPRTVALVHRIIVEIEKPLVLDADGLNALAQNPKIIKQRQQTNAAPLILTPHPGEAARLLGTTIEAIQSDRIASVRELSAKYEAYVVLKGRHSLTADPEGNVVINTTGNPGMATGGSGDTLTGILGGFLARYFAGKTSTPHPTHTLGTVALAVLIHGVAGDMAAEQLGESALTAGDIAAHLPAALKRLEK